MKEIIKILRKRFEKTRDCGFKKDWIPKGWAAVKIEVFVKEVAEEIGEYLKGRAK